MFKQCDYELSQSPECPTKSQKISQLKSQLIQLEEDDKVYNDLLLKYRQLQKEYQLMNDAKLHLEYEYKQKNESMNKILEDLKCQNVDLTNELAEKNSIYEKLYADKTNLLNNLDERKKENDTFCKTAMNNDRIINELNQAKNKCENDAILLDNTTKKNDEDINNLCNQLNMLKLKNASQNEELNRRSIEINNNQNALNDVKNANENVNNQIKLKNAALDSVQNELNLANKTIVDLQNDINNLESNLNLGKDQLNKMNFEFQNQHIKRIQAEDDKNKLETILKDRDVTIERLNCVSDTLKNDRAKLIDGKNKLLADMEMYKNQIMVLTEQTEKLTNELQRIINEDSEAYNLNNSQIQRLQKLIYENQKLLHEEIEALNALETYVKSQPGIKEVPPNNNGNSRKVQGRQTYARKN
jgi:chromosome segregation ATPase